jgi:hypothetical protein
MFYQVLVYAPDLPLHSGIPGTENTHALTCKESHSIASSCTEAHGPLKRSCGCGNSEIRHGMRVVSTRSVFGNPTLERKVVSKSIHRFRSRGKCFVAALTH